MNDPMYLHNPKIDGTTTSVATLLSRIPREDPQKYMVAGTIEVPDWRGVSDHFQGIAPINGETRITGQISASSGDGGWFASFVEGSSQPARVTHVYSTPRYDHAGGIQRLGDLLPLPMENDDDFATVAFFDCRTSEYIYEFHIGQDKKASAAAITRYIDAQGNDWALLAIYRYDPMAFQLFLAPGGSVSANTWVNAGGTNSLPDDDQFQCFALVTQQNRRPDGTTYDEVYLLGFREDEHVGLFHFDTGSDYGHLTHVATYGRFHGSQWRYGVGLQIASSTNLRIFGCSEDPSGDRDDYDFPIYYWG